MKNVRKRIHEIMDSIGRPVRLMEVCGTHTMAMFRHGIRTLLPGDISLLSGPGCPVCVTPAADIEAVLRLGRDPAVILATFGDMIRVPGIRLSLAEARAGGADVRVVYSPLDALETAAANRNREVVFFATGFETTSPLVAATIQEADRRKIDNFTIYCVHKLVPPALDALLASGEVEVDGLILPGHVSAVIGAAPYAPLVTDYRMPSVITGFEAEDILSGILMLLEQIESGEPGLEIQYSRAVRAEGNPRALSLMREVFEAEDATWRGIGMLPGSGLRVRAAFEGRDAVKRFGISPPAVAEPSACRCGDVLKGISFPTDCGLFGKACTPERPVGACMVSSEGSCAAYYKYMPQH